MEILKDRIWYHRSQKIKIVKQIDDISRNLCSQIPERDFDSIVFCIKQKYQKAFIQCKKVQMGKLERLIEKQRAPTTASAPTQQKTVVNLSDKVLSDTQALVLSKGLNYALAPKTINTLDIVANVENALQRVDVADKDEIRWKVRSILEHHKPAVSNISRQERNALEELRKDNTIKISAADKGNATVILNAQDYLSKLKSMLIPEKYEILDKDPTKSIERKVYLQLRKFKDEFSDNSRSRLTPHYSKAPHIYGLPKIHKTDVPLRPIVSSIGSPCYNLAKYLVPIIKPLMGKTSSFVKNTEHFVEIIRRQMMKPNEILVSFDVESLFTNVPVDEALRVVKDRLEKEESLSERTGHSVECIMELLTVCVKTTYFRLENEFYQQKDGMAMGSPLSPVIANIYMEYFEELALRTAEHKPTLWLRYVDDTFVIWPHSIRELEKFKQHINSQHASIKFTVEMEKDNSIPFLDVLLKKQTDGSLATTVYRKPTHTGLYLNYSSNHHNSSKRTVALSLVNRAKTVCSSNRLLKLELNHIQNTLRSNGYTEKMIREAINHQNRPSHEEPDWQYVSLPYYRGVSDKIGKLLSKCNLKVAYNAGTTMRNILSRNDTNGNITNKNCVYSIPCQCGKNYIGETCRPLQIRVSEHQKKVTRGETSSSKIAEHAWSHGHHFDWQHAKPMLFEQNQFKRKWKESALISCSGTAISQSSLEFNPIWRKIIKRDTNKVITYANPLTDNEVVNSNDITPPITGPRPATHRYETRYKNRGKN